MPVSAQNANPFISIGTFPAGVVASPGGSGNSTLKVSAGNAGSTSIKANTLEVTIKAGENIEMSAPLGPNSDPRWTIQSLNKGAGNTMVLVNSGNSDFKDFDIGVIYILIRGKISSGNPNVINAYIKYVNNKEQGNESALDDQSSTSLWVGSGTSKINTAKPVPPVISQKQDMTISANGCEAILNWKVSGINKTVKIEVEYSKNNLEFTNLGEAKPKAGSTNEYEYKYDQGNGRGYYRLKLVQRDNSIEYSKLKEIVTTCVVKRGF